MGIIDKSGKTLEFIDKLSKLLEKMQNYKPEVKSLRINYLDKTTELKLLVNVPQGIKRRFRDIEIPAYPSYSIREVFDGATFDKIDVKWQLKNQNWISDAEDLGASDRYFVILQGQITEDSLAQLVKLYCPEDPKRTTEVDRYWIDSAIKDMSILEKIYDELTIDKVSTCVNVGVERQFASSIPKEVREWFRARAQADRYLASKDRGMSFRSFYRLRAAQRKMGKLSPTDVHNLASKALSPETFMYYIEVDKPFHISHLMPLEETSWYPEKIGVSVETDLNYRNPVAQGDLIYKKIEFASKLTEEVKKLPGLPDKLKK